MFEISVSRLNVYFGDASVWRGAIVGKGKVLQISVTWQGLEVRCGLKVLQN